MNAIRRGAWVVGPGLAMILMAGLSTSARAADRGHPMGIFPYGIFAPTMSDLWADLPRTEMKRMDRPTSWGMLGPMEYGCGGQSCGGYGAVNGGLGCGMGSFGCCGLTPLHWNAYAPSLYTKEGGPTPAERESSWYTQKKMAFLPIPGIDAPAIPPDVARGERPGAFHNAPGVPGHTPYAQQPNWYIRRAAATDPAAVPSYFGPYSQYQDPYNRP